MNSVTPPPTSPSQQQQPTANPSAASRLDYAPKVAQRTRWLRLGVLVVAALVLGALMPRMWTDFGYRVGRRSVQRDLMTHAVPADTVAYGANAYQNAPYWQSNFNIAGYFPGQETTLFVHARTSRGGKQRIVAVSLMNGPPQPGNAPRPIYVRVATAEILSFASPRAKAPRVWSDYVRLGAWPDPSATPAATFLFGQPDPADGSRFTIRYSVGEQTGALEGRLDDDSTITLTVIDGPVLDSGPVEPKQ